MAMDLLNCNMYECTGAVCIWFSRGCLEKPKFKTTPAATTISITGKAVEPKIYNLNASPTQAKVHFTGVTHQLYQGIMALVRLCKDNAACQAFTPSTRVVQATSAT